MVVDTACSSSLVACSLAHRCLADDCSASFVVGENLLLHPRMTVQYSQTKMMSSDGQCKTFDASANGYVRAEGCLAFLLDKSACQSDFNRHRVALLAAGVNQDGK